MKLSKSLFSIAFSIIFFASFAHAILQTDAQKEWHTDLYYESELTLPSEGEKTDLFFELKPLNPAQNDLNQIIYIDFEIINPEGNPVQMGYMEINPLISKSLIASTNYQFNEPGIWEVKYFSQYTSDLNKTGEYFNVENSLLYFSEIASSHKVIHILSFSEAQSLKLTKEAINATNFNGLIAVLVAVFAAFFGAYIQYRYSKKQEKEAIGRKIDALYYELELNKGLFGWFLSTNNHFEKGKAPMNNIETKCFDNAFVEGIIETEEIIAHMRQIHAPIISSKNLLERVRTGGGNKEDKLRDLKNITEIISNARFGDNGMPAQEAIDKLQKELLNYKKKFLKLRK